MYIKQPNSNIIVIDEKGPVTGDINDYPGFEAVDHLPENFTGLFYQKPSIRESALEVFNTLPVDVRAAFRTTKVAILNALEDGQQEEACYILQNTPVPLTLEPIKQNLLSILNS